MIYRCRECGKMFTEPGLSTENMGECHGLPSFVNFEACPYCGSDYFYDVDYEEEDAE